MELVVLEKSKTRLVVEGKGSDHTFWNVLKSELWNDKDVKASAYSVEHPLVGTPKLVLETKAKDPIKALADGASRIEKLNNDFLSKVKKL